MLLLFWKESHRCSWIFSGYTPIWYVRIKYGVLCLKKPLEWQLCWLHHDTLGSSRISPLTEIMPVAAGCIWNSLNAPFRDGTAETSKQRHTMLMSRLFMKHGLFLNLIRPSTNTSVISSFPTVCSWVLMVNTSGSLLCRLNAIWIFSTRTSVLNLFKLL